MIDQYLHGRIQQHIHNLSYLLHRIIIQQFNLVAFPDLIKSRLQFSVCRSKLWKCNVLSVYGNMDLLVVLC